MYLKERAKCSGNNLFLTFKCLLIIYLQSKLASLEFYGMGRGGGGSAKQVKHGMSDPEIKILSKVLS